MSSETDYDGVWDEDEDSDATPYSGAPQRDDSWRQYGHGKPAKARIEAEPSHFSHAFMDGALVFGLVLLTAWVLPAAVPLYQVAAGLAALTIVAWFAALRVTRSAAVCSYLLAWGVLLTGWFAAARILGPWHSYAIASLAIGVLALSLLGPVVAGHHREQLAAEQRAREQRENTRPLREWERKLADHGAPGVTITDVIAFKSGDREIRGRLGKTTADRRAITYNQLASLAEEIAQSERLDEDGVYFSRPEGRQYSSADFIMHLRARRTGPRKVVHLPSGNRPASINDPIAIGVLDNGKEFTQTLREVCVLIIGLRGAGKSSAVNMFIARLAMCVDAVIWMIDTKGGRTSRPWMIPYLQGHAARPVLDRIAVTREETKLLLEDAATCGQIRARTGIGWEKLRPSVDHPAIVILCDDVGTVFGHGTREGGINNYGLATMGAKVVEEYRSEAIDLIGAGQRAVVDLWGTSAIKSQAEVRIGLRVTDAAEGARVFPDFPAAARTVARLRDPGDCLVKDRNGISPIVHLYRLDTEKRITNIALYAGDPDHCLRPELEPALTGAMGENYSQRWDRCEDLLKVWRESAGVPEPPDPGEGTEWESIAHLDFDPEKPPDPRRLKMREIVRDAGWAGISVARIMNRLRLASMDPPRRETVQRWLAEDEKEYGLVARGQHGSRNWRWTGGRRDDVP